MSLQATHRGLIGVDGHAFEHQHGSRSVCLVGLRAQSEATGRKVKRPLPLCEPHSSSDIEE
eukprot:47274-Eustigmatos_ZCMA.PRE.1